MVKFNHIRALVIGDLMLDEYMCGSADRISPEAPVPIISIETETSSLGGAGNVVNNLVAMGASVSVVGRIGNDAAGETIFAKLVDVGVDMRGVHISTGQPTTRKIRIISSGQQVLRVDKETRSQNSAAFMEEAMTFAENKIDDVDVVIFSDYNKGVVTKELIYKVTTLTEERNIPTLADPKGKNYLKYIGVDILTPNMEEARQAAGLDTSEMRLQDMYLTSRRIMDEVGIDKLLITCGRFGATLFERGKPPVKIPSKAKQVFDVSGAGDTVISLLALGIASGFSLLDAAKIANEAAGIVVGKVGTATVSMSEMEKYLTTEY